jgi:hypothetical protein
MQTVPRHFPPLFYSRDQLASYGADKKLMAPVVDEINQFGVDISFVFASPLHLYV